MLVGEHCLHAAVADPVQVMIYRVLVPVAGIVAVDRRVGVPPDLTLILHKIMAGIIDAILKMLDNLCLGSSAWKGILPITSGVEQEHTSQHSLSRILGGMTGHRRAGGVDFVRHQAYGLEEIALDDGVNFFHACPRKVDSLGVGPKRDTAENLHKLIVGKRAKEIGLADKAVHFLLG